MSNGSPADPGYLDVSSAVPASAPPTGVVGPATAPAAQKHEASLGECPPGESASPGLPNATSAVPTSAPPTPVAGPAAAPAAPELKKPLWKRQAGESAEAFEAAQEYFQFGADRSLKRVSRQISKDRSLMARWSQEWRWVERAAAYDQHMARVEQEAREKECAARAIRWEHRRDELRERAWATAEGLYSLVDRELKDEILNGQTLKPAELLNVLKRATELARYAVGDSPSRPGSGDP